MMLDKETLEALKKIISQLPDEEKQELLGVASEIEAKARLTNVTHLKSNRPRTSLAVQAPPLSDNKFDPASIVKQMNTDEYKEYLAASEVDDSVKQKLTEGEISRSSARPTQLIEVRCSICGRSEEVAPSLVHNRDRYRCNKCILNRDA